MSSQPIIRIRNLHYTYNPHSENPIHALTGIDLDIEAGSYVTIVGRNGSGKSTLARHLNALLLPTQGDVWVRDMNTKDAARRRDIRSTVGMVFQTPDNQLVATIVEEDVAFGPENLGVPHEELKRRVDWALDLVDMQAFRHRAPHLLSGGQKQRIAIAGILAMKPQVLVLDESTAMLDPLGRQEVVETARRLNRQEGVTIIAITHFMSEAVEADRVLVMDDGQIVMDGTPRQVFTQVERLRALQLDVPQVTQLAHRLHCHNGHFPSDILTVAEMIACIEGVTSQKESRVPSDGSRVTTHTSRLATPDSWAERVVEVEHLAHTYMKDTPLAAVALEDVSMEVYRGEIVGIIGHTGSGKSTLIQHFNGLMRPQQGRVMVLGKDLRDPKLDVKAIRRRVGIIFQFPEQQLFEQYVGDDIAFGPRNLKLSREEVRERVRWAMELVGLPFDEFKDRLTFGLSGGQMRRVAIAGVLAMRPEILIFDEPTSGLDPRGRVELLENIRALHRDHSFGDAQACTERSRSDKGMTVILVSHNMDELAQMAQRICVISEGRTVMQGEPWEVFREPDRLRELGLGVPQVTEVMHGLRARGMPVTTDVLTVDQAEAELRRLLEGATHFERASPLSSYG